MYLGFDYHHALGRQAELLRWAEDQRKVKLLRSSQAARQTASAGVSVPGVDQNLARPLGNEVPEERRAS